jgi:hypothetical protein
MYGRCLSRKTVFTKQKLAADFVIFIACYAQSQNKTKQSMLHVLRIRVTRALSTKRAKRFVGSKFKQTMHKTIQSGTSLSTAVVDHAASTI